MKKKTDKPPQNDRFATEEEIRETVRTNRDIYKALKAIADAAATDKKSDS